MNNWLKYIFPPTLENLEGSGLNCVLTEGMKHLFDLLTGQNVMACFDEAPLC